MNKVKYNIKHFKISTKDDWYKCLFNFLIRYFFNSKNFSGKFSKEEFIEIGKKFGFSEIFLKNVYQRGKIDNHFLLETRRKNNKEIIFIKGLNLEEEGSMIVVLDEKIIKKVVDLRTFKYLSYIIIASNISISTEKIKEEEYIAKCKSRSLKTIGKSFGNKSKSTMSIRLKKAKEYFSEFFNITHRYKPYNGYLMQTTNLYSIKGIKYKFRRKKDSNIFLVKPRFIKTKKEVFGDLTGIKGFLPEDAYKMIKFY